MKAWVVERITEEGELKLLDVPTPVPSSDQYLVRVEAAGLNFLDTLVPRGRYQTKPALPFTPGMEVAGRIVGGDPAGLRDGTRVVCSVHFGGFAEYALVPRGGAIPIGDEMPMEAALALRGNYPTSLYALRNVAQLKAGETLLVHAGAGGVGSAAVRLGKLMGARVIATAGGPHKVAACKAIGADEALDYNSGDWLATVREMVPGGVDVIYDPVGGEVGVRSMRCLAWGARYLVIGFAGGTLTQLPANRLLLQGASAIGVLWGEMRKRDPQLADNLTNDVFNWYREGKLTNLATESHAFEDAPQALHALEARKSTGKVLLKIKVAD
ncbi:MAG: NADPH:quinone oxidoreductase family protein [Janthinobacterium lividum]